MSGEDLDSWGDASPDTEILLMGRKAACNGEESRGGETGRKLWRAKSSGWEWESRGEEWEKWENRGEEYGRRQLGSAGRKDLPHPGWLAGLEPGWTVDAGVALLPSSGTESRARRGRGSLVAYLRKTRRREKLRRDGSLELFPPPPSSSSSCPRTSRQG